MKEKNLKLQPYILVHTGRRSAGLLCCCAMALFWALFSEPVWAYRTEKICTESAATAADPPIKTCKIVRMTPEREAEFKAELLEKQKALKAQKGEKGEKKEEKKKSGH